MTEPHQDHSHNEPPTYRYPHLPPAAAAHRPTVPAIRTIYHRDALTPRGIAITCARCHGQRNWLLICINSALFVRCRCTHEFREPDLTLADFNALFTHIERVYEGGLEEIYRSTGFDGLLAGAEWD